MKNFKPQHFNWRMEGGVAVVTFNRPEHKNPIIFDSYAELETLYRGIKSLRIYEGASDVQKIIIARSVLS